MLPPAYHLTRYWLVTQGASLVKGIPFDTTDKDVAGPDIFQKLIPMEAHEHASLYR